MVSDAVQKLMSGYGAKNFSFDVWSGLKFAFTTYGHTAECLKYKIGAGQTPWFRLTSDNYKTYINSQKENVDKATNLKSIDAVKRYILNQ
jgi:hypothetical protein